MPTAATLAIREAVRNVWAPVFTLQAACAAPYTDEQAAALKAARELARRDTLGILTRHVTVTAADLEPPRVKCVGAMSGPELVKALGGKGAKPPALKLTKADLEPPTVVCIATMSQKQIVQELGRNVKRWTLGHAPLLESERVPDIGPAEGSADACADERGNARAEAASA